MIAKRKTLRNGSTGSVTLARDHADLPRLGHVTRARVTQIMNLLNLAPDIQGAILFLLPVKFGRDPNCSSDRSRSLPTGGSNARGGGQLALNSLTDFRHRARPFRARLRSSTSTSVTPLWISHMILITML